MSATDQTRVLFARRLGSKPGRGCIA